MFIMWMKDCTLLKQAVKWVRDIPLTIDDVFGIRLILSRHGVAAARWVLQPRRLMAVVISMNGPSNFDTFAWLEDGYRASCISLDQFFSSFQLQGPGDFIVYGSKDDDKVSFTIAGSGIPRAIRLEFGTDRLFDEPPEVDEYVGSIMTMASVWFEVLLYYFDVPEEGFENSIWVQRFYDCVRFTDGRKQLWLGQQSGLYESMPGTGQVIEISMSYASLFFKALETSEKVSIIASYDDNWILLKFTSSNKGSADLIFFLKGLPINLVR